MTFNNDVSVTDVFSEVFKLVMGYESGGFTVLEVSYSIGLAVGIIGFFNHFAAIKLNTDPTPLEVEMRLYEDNISKTGTRKHIFLYETVIILGGVLGNILDIYEFPIYMGPYLGTLFICAYGLSVGIFVGCLVMSLAETLKALPVISRRIHLAVGLQYLIFALAAGKMAGSLVYFWNHIASLG